MDLPQRTQSHRWGHSDESVATATKLGFLLFIVSTYWYKKQIYAHDRQLFNMVLFGTGSLFSSMAIARFMVETPYAAAARRNNYHELKHLRQIGHL